MNSYKKSNIKRFSETITVEHYAKNPLTDWPVSHDLEAGSKGQVWEDPALIETLDNLICSAAPRRGLLRGAEGRGKTVLSRLFAYKKEQQGWDVYVVDIRIISTLSIKQLKFPRFIRTGRREPRSAWFK